MKNWFNKRIILYIIYMLTFYIFWRIFGFEFTVIIALGQIMGEVVYKKNNNEAKI